MPTERRYPKSLLTSDMIQKVLLRAYPPQMLSGKADCIQTIEQGFTSGLRIRRHRLLKITLRPSFPAIPKRIASPFSRVAVAA